MTDYKQQDSEKASKSKPTFRQWFWGIFACLATIAFVIWTGYYAVLILIPVFIDIYITKFIPWAKWKESKNPVVKKILDWVDAILFALVAVYVIMTFFFQNYQIPTSSLEKSLLVGDFLCVNKMVYGARSPMTPLSFPLMQHTVPIFGGKSYFENPKLEYKRFKGLRSIERYDIVVFNYPSGDTVALNMQNQDYYDLVDRYGWQKVNTDQATFGKIVYRPVDRRENYVKRCVGLPGDILEIRNDSTFINGKLLNNPEHMQLLYTVQTDGTPISPAVFDELGISKDDQLDIYWKQLPDDSASLTLLGMDISKPKGGLVYDNINMTKEMLEKMAAKPFVKKILTRSEYYANLKVFNPASFNNLNIQSVYPITYYKNIPQGNYPATWIPKKGETLRFDDHIDYKVAAYGRCIKNYEGNDFEYRDGKVYINGSESTSYTFKYDYYFMMGDNRDKSADSRLWGFVPEDHIVGSPMFIWLSFDKDKKGLSSIRWERIFTNGNKNK